MAGDLLRRPTVTRDWMAATRSTAKAAPPSPRDSKIRRNSGFDQGCDRRAIGAAMHAAAEYQRRLYDRQQVAKNECLGQAAAFPKGAGSLVTLLVENMWGKRRSWRVYLNVAETCIGLTGQCDRFAISARTRRDSRVEAARIAAIRPLPEARAIAPRAHRARQLDAPGSGVGANEGLTLRLREGRRAARSSPRRAAETGQTPAAPRAGRPAAARRGIEQPQPLRRAKPAARRATRLRRRHPIRRRQGTRRSVKRHHGACSGSNRKVTGVARETRRRQG